MPKLFTPEDLAAMVAIRTTFNPDGRCSPSKMLPDRRPLHRAKEPGAPGLGVRKPVIHWRRLVRYDGNCGTVGPRLEFHKCAAVQSDMLARFHSAQEETPWRGQA